MNLKSLFAIVISIKINCPVIICRALVIGWLYDQWYQKQQHLLIQLESHQYVLKVEQVWHFYHLNQDWITTNTYDHQNYQNNFHLNNLIHDWHMQYKLFLHLYLILQIMATLFFIIYTIAFTYIQCIILILKKFIYLLFPQCLLTKTNKFWGRFFNFDKFSFNIKHNWLPDMDSICFTVQTNDSDIQYVKKLFGHTLIDLFGREFQNEERIFSWLWLYHSMDRSL